jgi:hypothetical protein
MMAQKRKLKASSLTAAAKLLGKKGGKKGGPARAKALTPGQREKIAAAGGRAKARQQYGS